MLKVWYALVAPPGTNHVTVGRLNGIVTSVLKDPAMSRRFHDMGTDAMPLGVEETELFLARERALWERVANENNIQKQ